MSCSEVCEVLVPLLQEAGFSEDGLALDDEHSHEAVLSCLRRSKIFSVCVFDLTSLDLEMPMCRTHGQFLADCWEQKKYGVFEALFARRCLTAVANGKETNQ